MVSIKLLKTLVLTYFIIANNNVKCNDIVGIDYSNIRLLMWENNQPYDGYHDIYKGQNIDYRPPGIVPILFYRKYIPICKFPISLETRNPEYLEKHEQLIDIITTHNNTQLFQKLNITSLDDQIIVLGTTSFQKLNLINENFEAIELFKTKPVVIVPERQLLLLVKFFNVATGGLIIVFFATMCAVLVSAPIWLIEHLAGTNTFPDRFGAGLLSSFWFAFITMATVGYGDKVPKHPFSRILSILWIIFGLAMVALITTVVWTSITADFITKNKNIAVMRNSSEEVFAKNILFGKPKTYNTYEELFYSIQSGDTDIGLIDEKVAAYKFDKENIEDLIPERILDTQIKYHIFALYNATRVGCVRKIESNLEDIAEEAEVISSIVLPPLEINKFHVRPLSKTFNNTDKGIMVYTTLIATMIIVIAVASEILFRLNCFNRKKEQQIVEDKIEMKYNNNNTEDFIKSREYKQFLEAKAHFEKALQSLEQQAKTEYYKNNLNYNNGYTIEETT